MTHSNLRSIRALLPYTSAAVLAAALYAAWTLWSRHRETQRIQEQQQAEEAKRDAEVTRIYGSGNLKILSFYASPGIVERGERALVCYGVSNAKSVQIEPHIEDIQPSISRCLEVHPRADTEYKLTAADARGHKLEQSFTLRVAK